MHELSQQFSAMYTSKLKRWLTTWTVLVTTGASVLVLLILHVQFYNAILLAETNSETTVKRAVISAVLENQSEITLDYQVNTNSTVLDGSSISVVHPLSHYGADLCLLYNTSHHKRRHYQHPNIVHYVKLSNTEADTELKLLDYTSIVSVDKFYKPDKIVIHSNRNVTGHLWNLANSLQTEIEVQHIERLATIGKLRYKRPVSITHEADLHKLDVAMREGGIVMDFDVIILKGNNLRRQQATAECVLGIERACTFVNSGFISCTPNSEFVRQWRESYEEDYRNTWTEYLYNSGEYPASLLRQCPSCYDVYLDPEISMSPDAGAPGGPGPGRKPWIRENGVNWQDKTVVHILLHHLQVPKTKYLLNLWNCSYRELVVYVLGEGHRQFLPSIRPHS